MSTFFHHLDSSVKSLCYRLVNRFKDPATKLYCLFVQSVIPMFDSYNTFLQAPEPLVHLLHQSTTRLLHSLLSRFVLPEVISSAEDLSEIDLKDPSNLKDVNSIFIGITTKQYARSSDSDYLIGTHAYKKFLNDSRDFFIVCATYLQKSVPVLKNEILKSLTFLRLPDRHLATEAEIGTLLKRFPDVIDKGEINDLHLQLLEFQSLADESLPAYQDDDGNRIRIDAVWRDIGKIKDPCSGSPRFPVLVKLAQAMLLIPHSNAYCESIFSTVRKICTDGRHNLGKNAEQGHAATSVYNETTNVRNTLLGILLTKINIFQKKKIVCHEWKPSDKLVKAAKSATYEDLQARKKAIEKQNEDDSS